MQFLIYSLIIELKKIQDANEELSRKNAELVKQSKQLLTIQPPLTKG